MILKNIVLHILLKLVLVSHLFLGKMQKRLIDIVGTLLNWPGLFKVFFFPLRDDRYLCDYLKQFTQLVKTFALIKTL